MGARKPLCIVTGLSGAGKTTALRAFEDLGFFTVDGLPASLSPDISAMMEKPAMSHFAGLAIGMDMREGNFLEEFNKALLDLSVNGMAVSLVFLEASDQELLRRYASTRRPHPLERKAIGLAGAIAHERAQLKALREMADFVVDSSDFSIHDLRRAIHNHYSKDKQSHSLRLNVISFGYKYGIPEDADYVFDIRFLDNPFFVPELKEHSGRDADVAAYVFKSGAATEFLRKTMTLFKFILPQMEIEGRSRVTIALGCTGGRHRSVAVAERLAQELGQSGYPLVLEHRNLDSDRYLA